MRTMCYNFLKDHLGNVRMVLTDEVKADTYMCTMEDGAISTEGQLFRLYRVFFTCKLLKIKCSSLNCCLWKTR